MFEKCAFVMGEGNSIYIVVPMELPEGKSVTVSVSEKDIRFKSGRNHLAEIAYDNAEVYSRLSRFSQVGLMEYPEGEAYPNCITAIAYVELRRAEA